METKSLKRTLRRTLQKLNIPFTEQRTGWRKSGRFGYSPIFSLIISVEDFNLKLNPYLEITKSKRIAAKQRATKRRLKEQQEKEDLAYSLNLLPSSKTFQSFLNGEISDEEAKRIGEKMQYRHERTNYEELLAEGFDKDSARELMKPIV